MAHQIFNSSFATAHRRLPSLAPVRQLAQRLAPPSSPRASVRALPLGMLWDPTLLNRLQLPLSRHRE